MSDYSKYEQMRDSGATAHDVYLALKTNHYPFIDCIRVLRFVFDLSLIEAKEVSVSGKNIRTDYRKYEQMRDAGLTAHDVYLALKANSYPFTDCLRILRLVFDLSLVEAKEVSVIGDGLAHSLDEYQEKLYPAIKGAIEMAILEDAVHGAYTIRLATPTDIPTIMHQRRAMFEDMQLTSFMETPGVDAAFIEWVTPRLTNGEYIGFLALDEQSTVIAGAGLWLIDWIPQVPDLSTRRAYVMNVFVDEAHRRQGVARLLVDTLLNWCRVQGIQHLTLHASDKGRSLYESFGFAATNEMRLLLV